MVTVKFDQLDDLAYHDYSTPEDRARVEEMIQQEMADTYGAGARDLHPGVINLLPLQIAERPLHMTNNGIIRHHLEIERYEEENEEQHMSPLQSSSSAANGIDMNRYSEFTTSEGEIEYDNLYSTLSYSLLHQRNLEIASEFTENTVMNQQNELERLRKIRHEQQLALRQKRERTEELNEERKRRQTEDFAPTEEYLEARWRGGIQSVLDMTIERARQ